MSITPTRYELALLDTISSTESPDYNVLYGGSTFNGYDQHPGIYKDIVSGPNKGRKTSAAGRYQFLESTWNGIANRYHLSDFSPRNQDIGAVALAREDYNRRTGRDLTADLESNDPAILAGVGRALSGTWTSLPSGIEEGQDADKFVTSFTEALSGSLDNASISARMNHANSEAGASMASAKAPEEEAPESEGASTYVAPAPHRTFAADVIGGFLLTNHGLG